MKVRKNKRTEKAVRIFTDREEPRASFWKKYNEVNVEMRQEDSNVRVLNYYGIGGIGKSSLLKKIMSEMEEKLHTPQYIYIDLSICQESRAILDRMKNQLSEKYAFDFPLYELSSYVYAKSIGENTDSIEIKQLTEQSTILKMLFSVAGEIPIVGIAAKVISLADQGIAYIRTHLKNHSSELKQLESMKQDELYESLPYYFAQDLAYNLEKKANEPLVIMLDTYEKLVNEISANGEPAACDEWIRGEKGLVQNIPNTLWVIAGREKLKWDAFDSEWLDAVEHHILGNLSFADSNSFLLNAGINDAKLRKQLYNLTGGTPVYLDLCVDQFFCILSEGKYPDISMFGHNTLELIERFVRYMDDSQKEFVYMLSCLHKWDDSLIFDIAPSVLSGFNAISYEKAKGYSFIICSENNNYILHQTVSNVLFSNCPCTIKQKVGNILIEKFSEILEKNNLFSQEYISALLNINHAGQLLYNDRENLKTFYENNIMERTEKLAIAGMFNVAESIIASNLSIAEQNKKDMFYATMLNEKANLYIIKEKYELAKKLLLKSLKIHINILGLENKDTLTIINNLLYTMFDLGETDKALKLQYYLIEKCEKEFSNTSEITLIAKNNLATQLMELQKPQEALDILKDVVRLRKEISGIDHHSTLLAMHNMALALYNTNDKQHSITILQFLIKKYEELSLFKHPRRIVAMEILSEIFDEINEIDKANSIREELKILSKD